MHFVWGGNRFPGCRQSAGSPLITAIPLICSPTWLCPCRCPLLGWHGRGAQLGDRATLRVPKTGLGGAPLALQHPTLIIHQRRKELGAGEAKLHPNPAALALPVGDRGCPSPRALKEGADGFQGPQGYSEELRPDMKGAKGVESSSTADDTCHALKLSPAVPGLWPEPAGASWKVLLSKRNGPGSETLIHEMYQKHPSLRSHRLVETSQSSAAAPGEENSAKDV